MKKLTYALATATATLAGCSGIDPTGDTTGAFVGGALGVGVAELAGANENVQIIAAILGAAGGQSVNRASTGGCIRTGTTSPVFRGGHVFYNPRLGVIQCPVGSIKNSKIVDNLYKDPNWQPIVRSGGLRGGLGARGFNFMADDSGYFPTLDTELDMSNVIDHSDTELLIKALIEMYPNSKKEIQQTLTP